MRDYVDDVAGQWVQNGQPVDFIMQQQLHRIVNTDGEMTTMMEKHRKKHEMNWREQQKLI